MQESKIEATHRLQREQRWPEASSFKDSVIKECRSEGKTRAEASEIAWERMIAEYPPLAVEPDQESEVDLVGVDDLPDSSPTGFLADATWVYNNLARATVNTASAPSAGAVGLLRWARRNEDDFFENVWPKVLGLASKQEPNEDDEVEAALAHVRSLEEMLGMTATV